MVICSKAVQRPLSKLPPTATAHRNRDLVVVIVIQTLPQLLQYGQLIA